MRRHRRTRKEIKKRNITIVMVIVFLISVFSVGYGAFQANLNIRVIGKAKRTDFYVSNTGSDENGDGTLNNPYLTIQKAYSEAYKRANIYIMNDISQSTTININDNKKITLTSYSTSNVSHSIIKTAAINGFLIRQTKGELILKKIILDGNNIEDTRGGIYINESKGIIEDGTIIKNFISNSYSGGGIHIENSDVTINDTTISDNKAQAAGGIQSHSSNLSIIGGLISNNYTTSSSGNGGGIQIGGGSFRLDGTTVDGNYSENCAGGIHLYNSARSEIFNGIVSNNTSKKDTGGIRSVSGTTTTISNMNIFGNKSIEAHSGGICCSRCTMNIYNSTVSNNSSKYEGGGIWTDDYTITLINIYGSIIKNNISSNSNGGIYKAPSPTLNYTDTIICENTPSNEYDLPVCPS